MKPAHGGCKRSNWKLDVAKSLNVKMLTSFRMSTTIFRTLYEVYIDLFNDSSQFGTTQILFNYFQSLTFATVKIKILTPNAKKSTQHGLIENYFS